MKKLNVFLVSVLATLALNAAVIEQVIVRQQWPWSTDVKVEYKISAVTNPVDITVQAFNGATELLLPAEAITGDRYGVTEDGVGTLVIDPVKAFGTEKVALANFKVKLTVADSNEGMMRALYKIYDLQDGTVVDVSKADLLNGKYGTVETDFGKIGDGYKTELTDVVIWTGVTNNIDYKTRKLVMRRIPAKNVTWTMGAPADEPSIISETLERQHQVTFTNDYWVGVFEFTQGQMSALNGKEWNENYALPKANDAWNDFIPRFAKLNEKFSCTGFGYITEAQWEFACRAGTTTGLYSGKEFTSGNVNELGWVKGGPGVVEGMAVAVGQLRPNAYGLYDMVGNASEFCADWFYNGPLGDLNQTVNPTGATTGTEKILRGGGVLYWGDHARSACRSIHFTPEYYNFSLNFYGWRVCCTIDE